MSGSSRVASFQTSISGAVASPTILIISFSISVDGAFKPDEEKRRFVEAIGNPSRLKILMVLWKSDKELTVYKICQRTGLGRSATSRHLRNLVEVGFVSRRIYGEIPLHSICREDFKVRALIDFFAKSKL